MTETTPDTFPSLFAAYSIVWLLVVLYMHSCSKRLRKLESKNTESGQS